MGRHDQKTQKISIQGHQLPHIEKVSAGAKKNSLLRPPHPQRGNGQVIIGHW